MARPMADLAIEAVDLVRTYKTHTGVIRRRPIDVEAVRGISFDVQPGELFGLLGPNGAGKTTTIKMLVTLLLPKGLLGTFQAWWDGRKERQLAADADSAAAEDGVIEPHPRGVNP